MPNLLKQLELDELSLVDRPANKQAMVSLYKRDNSEGDTMENEVEKMSDDMPEFVTYGDEQINKADIPAVILKALEEAEVAKADAILVKHAEAELPNFDIEVAKSLVANFGDEETIMQALKAADKAFADSMTELGKSDVDGEFATATDKLEALVKSYMDDNKMKKSQHALAYAAVAKTDEGKALITKSYKGE